MGCEHLGGWWVTYGSGCSSVRRSVGFPEKEVSMCTSMSREMDAEVQELRPEYITGWISEKGANK